MRFTERNHTNPCFWTAFWNVDYYGQATRSQCSTELSAREQQILALNVKADKIISTTVENVHFDKKLGIAEITAEAAADFCRRTQPYEYAAFMADHNPEDYPVSMDFENILTGIESTLAYSTLRKVIKSNGVDGPQDKVNLSCFLAIHHMRSHAILKSMIEATEFIGRPKWEYFVWFKNAISSPRFLLRAAYPFASAQWILYRTEEHTFPLCDTPVLVRDGHVMIALSPRLMLEIDMRVRVSEDSWIEKDAVHKSKIKEFLRRTIGNTFKEIIFHDRERLEQWRALPEFRSRVKAMANVQSYNRLICSETNRDVLHIDAFGNQV